jgi:HKD family nuclease
MLAGLLLLWLIAYLISAIYQVYKPLPEGISVAAPLRAAEQVKFLADYTYSDGDGKSSGERHQQQQIFDEALRMIGDAKRLILLDMFLFNDYVGKSTSTNRPLSAQVTQALIAKKIAYPDMSIIVITDPVNTVYGGQEAKNLTALRSAGITVVESNLLPLRASNPLWSGFWYLCCQGVGNNPEGGWLPNPLGSDKITLRSYFALFNFKANHRKTLVVDSPNGWQGLVTSANPHDASSWHDNVALQFEGQAALDLLETERAVASMSGAEVPMILIGQPPDVPQVNGSQLQILTEAKIRDAVLASLNGAQRGDQLSIAMFYFSHRPIINALKEAQQRGVKIRLILDPNEDAFGMKKNGIPNRQVAMELQQAGVPMRWCNTHGEQCHSKILLNIKTSGQAELILGSANYTRRNLDDLNLETNVRLLADQHSDAIQQANQYFDTVWTNRDQQRFSVDYAAYKDESRLKYWWYRFSEWSGLSTF